MEKEIQKIAIDNPSWTKFIFFKKIFTRDNFVALVSALERNTTITSLHMYDTKIGDLGIAEIINVLKTKTTLTELLLNDNLIGTNASIAIASFLKTNGTLSRLILNENQIEDAGAKVIADALKTNSTLTSLELNENQIGNKGAIAIADALKKNDTLRNLNMYGNQIGTKGAIAIADALKKNDTLRTLNLYGNQIGDEGAASFADALKTNVGLVGLYLAKNAITEAGVIVLANAFKENVLRTQLIEIRDLPSSTIIEKEVKKSVDRNQNAHRRVRAYIAAKRAELNLTKDAAQLFANAIWKTRGEPQWWTPEEDERGIFGVVHPEPHEDMRKCIQCGIQNAICKERDTPSRVFCGSFCQILHYNKGKE